MFGLRESSRHQGSPTVLLPSQRILTNESALGQAVMARAAVTTASIESWGRLGEGFEGLLDCFHAQEAAMDNPHGDAAACVGRRLREEVGITQVRQRGVATTGCAGCDWQGGQVSEGRFLHFDAFRNALHCAHQ